MKKIIVTSLIIFATTILFGCGKKESSLNGENYGLEENATSAESEQYANTDTNGVPVGKYADDAMVEEIDDWSGDNSICEQDNTQKVSATKEVEIDGKKYLEVEYIEGSQSLDYCFDGYGVTVVSSWEEVGDVLYFDKDNNTFSFDVVASGGGKIQGMLISGDYNHDPIQFGNTDILEFSNLYKDNGDDDFHSTVSFGKAYYDYDKTLYVDVMITVPGKFYTDTVVMNLEQ